MIIWFYKVFQTVAVGKTLEFVAADPGSNPAKIFANFEIGEFYRHKLRHKEQFKLKIGKINIEK